MSRPSPHPSTTVNFRMPNDLLKKIDEKAAASMHDRTAEINSACRFWIETRENGMGEDAALQKISELEKRMGSLETEIQTVKSQTNGERLLLLKIIENHEHTIKRLLSTLPGDRPENE